MDVISNFLEVPITLCLSSISPAASNPMVSKVRPAGHPVVESNPRKSRVRFLAVNFPDIFNILSAIYS